METYVNYYFYVSTVIYFHFFIIWKRSDILNVFYKTAFFLMGMWGLLNILVILGFIVKI